jgi:hypothetical protein
VPPLAHHLKIVLDPKLPIDVEGLSDSPAGHLEDGLPPDVEQAGRIETPGMPAKHLDTVVRTSTIPWELFDAERLFAPHPDGR